MKFTLKPGSYDLYLMIITALTLVMMGLVCLYGIWVYSYAEQSDPFWAETALYEDYINSMNQLMYPFAVLLLIVLGLCIPKRIISKKQLLAAGAVLLGMTFIVERLTGINTSLEFLLGVSILLQTVVVILTILRQSGLKYENEGYFIRVGSSMLHLGVVLFIFDFVSMRSSIHHISIFWVATVLITAGTVLSFYSDKIRTCLISRRL
ncbi:MAG: hypothetical protein KAJ93_05855 [Methanosarcinales archaeon]|nr:hypothetical protein [Methanosarcinales archaeon]